MQEFEACQRKSNRRVEATSSLKRKRSHLSQTEIPRVSLNDALRIPKALAEQYGKHPATPVDVGAAIGIRPTSGGFRELTGASIAYGMTEGGYNAPMISLTALGKRIVAPTEEGDDAKALQEAFLNPRIISDFLTRYDGSPFPTDQIAKNVLEGMGVPGERLTDGLTLIKSSAEDLGFLVPINGKGYVQLKGATAKRAGANPSVTPTLDEEPLTEVATVTPLLQAPKAEETAPSKPLFIAHGKKKGALEKLEKVLKEFNVAYRVAISEPNLGRPIPVKVKQIMSQCGSAILIFTKDEVFKDADGNDVWRPSENVVFELGAASYAYEDQVVILKEKGLNFPTDYGSVGHIEFVEDDIQAKAIDLLKELVGMKLLKLTPA